MKAFVLIEFLSKFTLKFIVMLGGFLELMVIPRKFKWTQSEHEPNLMHDLASDLDLNPRSVSIQDLGLKPKM